MDRFQVPKSGRRPRAFVGGNGTDQDRPQDARVETGLQTRPRSGKHAATRVIQDAHHQEQERDQDDERHQRRFGAGRQNPVVYLEHEQGARQHQQVHGYAE